MIIMGAASALNKSAIETPWNYKGSTGPEHWGSLSQSFILCATGKMQSPINIPKKTITTARNLNIDYQSAAMRISGDDITELMIGNEQTIINDGHTVQLNFPLQQNSEVITLQNQKYKLVQFHVHSPSETQWHGQAFPLELHFVHQGDSGKIAVLAVFIKAGEANATLQKIINYLPQKSGQQIEISGEQIDPANLLPTRRDYYSFMGSLTTPPCLENVQWVVFAQAITASPAQIVELRKAMHGPNARPVQPLKGRKIFYSTVKTSS